MRGSSIGEAEATTGRIVVRYIYSRNEKVATSHEMREEQALPGFPGSVLVRLCEHAATTTNPRVDDQSGARSWYYFINNAQGTPVLILDESGGTISRVNLDEWGNVGQLIGPASEVNYTEKKAALSQQGSGYASLCVRRVLVSRLCGEHGEANLKLPETGLYYFNQRYYDPSLGRFLTEDPAGQGLNPYAYAGNSPLMYVDPDGEWFWLAGMIIGGVIGGWGKDLSKIESWGSIAMGAAVGAMAGAGLDYVAANAGLSVKIAADLPYVGQVNLASMDFVGPGLVAAGAAASAGRDQFRQDQFNAQERAHDMTGEFDSYYQTGVVESDFCYPCGGPMEDFKKGLGFSVDGMRGFGQELGGFARAVGNVAAGIPDPVYDVANILLGGAEVVAYGTGVGAIPIGAANIVVNSGALYKTYKSEGASRNFKMQMAFAAAGPAAGVFGKGFGVAVGGVLNRAGLLYGN